MKKCFPGWEPRIIAIVGPSGAGKSWLAAALQQRLGKEAARLCLDDFYLDRSHLSLARRALVNFDHPRSIDWKALETALAGCKAGQTVRTPTYDFTHHARRQQFELRRPKPLLLVEGLWLLRRPSLRRLFSYRIFLRCKPSLQLRRRLARDTVERGRSAGSVRKQFQERVLPMGQRYVHPQERWADLVLNAPISSEAVEELAGRLQKLAHGK